MPPFLYRLEGPADIRYGYDGSEYKNAGDARSIGGEMDLNWELFPNLTYFLSAGYSNSKYYHHLTKEYEGNRIVMAPEFTGNTGIAYQKRFVQAGAGPWEYRQMSPVSVPSILTKPTG